MASGKSTWDQIQEGREREQIRSGNVRSEDLPEQERQVRALDRLRNERD